jgi:hypothetical protein
MTRISNMNNISVRTYGEKGETLAVIRELKKLGIIKSKKKRKAKTMNDLKQESDMVGYVKTLEGEKERGNPNIFSLRQIEPGMSQQQIADITERNNAGVAALRAEIQQQRLEDLQSTLEPLTRLANLASERFRGAQEPGAGQRPNPFVQSTTVEEIPDIQEGGEAFTQTLNEGGPQDAPIKKQTEFFAEGEEARARLGPQERLQIGGGSMSTAAAEILGMPESFIAKTRKATKPKKKLIRDPQDASDELGLGKIPTMRNTYDVIEKFYFALTDAIPEGSRDPNANSKSLILADINRILERQL